MNVIQALLFLLAIINLVTISVLIYFKKSNWAVGLSIVEIILVYLNSIA